MNKVILMGRLTKDPEMRYTNVSNIPVCHFTLAVNRKFKRQGEERQADFIPVVSWDKLAEFCSRYFVKGQQVAVTGRIQVRTWDDNDGKRHYVTEVVAEEAYFADSKKESGVNNESSVKEDENKNLDAHNHEDLPF
ncbi:single-stranded DNA-binding protein [Herbivorax sp. ANBcel31]|uniref:single-stranded DNA-binding protein n=1 Tax=Herbivorax sp. ANBcel31 TaxID=3069754 RepID=UPI0027B2CBAA|nr:single-stranded DNA-binding protein [Herbivorax sp. ANBcel31]MDQ2087549.1 single-stranded DNA-binding protein [Herbivorax sp. ANBcel31]